MFVLSIFKVKPFAHIVQCSLSLYL